MFRTVAEEDLARRAAGSSETPREGTTPTLAEQPTIDPAGGATTPPADTIARDGIIDAREVSVQERVE